MKLIELSKTGKKNKGKYFAMVDDADYEWLNNMNWHISMSSNLVYAYTTIGGKRKSMHRFILGLTDPNIEGDHIDGNTLNYQRLNLRIATVRQNRCNRRAKKNGTSKYLGVSRKNSIQKYTNKKGKISIAVNYYWRAQIKANKINFRLGTFKSEIDAAKAYNEAAKKHHGEFARLNILTKGTV